METRDILKQSIEAASRVGLSHRVDSLWDEEKRLQDQRYRVAVVGQFKTGKSTLINRIFLKSNLLFTDVLEATSIPTEVAYGEKPRLEVYRYEKKSFSVQEGNLQIEQDYISGSVLDRAIDNPSLEEIQKATSADSPEERASLAATTSHAHLSWPAENLKQFTVIDTPGINTPNDAVVTTTYRILPECDTVIFVAQPRALAQVDVEFLRSRVFECGITRCIIVLHYDPRFTDLSKDQLAKIKAANEGQLKTIGRGEIPVTIAEFSRTGGLIDGQFGRSAVSSSTDFDVWLDSSSAKSLKSLDVSGEILPIERDLLNFIHENVRPGKEEKIRIRIRKIIESALAECQIELALTEKSETERKGAEDKIARTQQTTTTETQLIKEDFLSDLRALKQKHILKITKGLDLLQRTFGTELNNCQSLGDIQTRVQDLKQLAQLETENLAAQVAQAVREEFRELERNYSLRLRKVANSWQEVDVALKIDGGLLEKAPGWLIAVLDGILVVVVSPFPFFVDLVLRYFADKIPGLKNVLPANIATTALRALISRSMIEQFSKVREVVTERLNTGYAQAEIALSQAWDAQAHEQTAMVSGAVERAAKPTGSARGGELRAAINTFKRILPELPILGVPK